MMDDHKNSDNDSSEAESENSSSGSDSSGGSSSAFQGAPDILDTPDVLPIVPEKRLFIKLIQSEFPVSDCRQKVNHPDPRKRSFPAGDGEDTRSESCHEEKKTCHEKCDQPEEKEG
ncbi:uncharacterized protein [Diabrotica undecimpunctata]|uniref:uncharacterized protein isoform X1 n=1 Tax=Diabrotica undecimpunctata TaxID=50387 RepID=UPI003B63E1E2